MIRVNGLTKEFTLKRKGKKEIFKAVNNVSFEIEQGETVAFIGPNGAGKSTTIKMLTGIIHKTNGEISVLGFDPQSDRINLVKNIGCLFGQKSSLWMHLPAIESYRLFGAVYDIDKDVLEDRINYLADLFEAWDIINEPVKKLSLGQRMKAEILASLLHKPRILFLDEPTIGLDIMSKKKILDIIKKINEEENVTVFLTSHDMSDVEKLCKRIIIIDNGSLVLDSKISDLKAKYSKTRIVTVGYDSISRSNLICDNLIKFDEKENVATYEFQKTDTNFAKKISQLITVGEVSDIKIDETSLETIIQDIYKEDRQNE